MAEFLVGQTVRITHNPSAPTHWWDRIGKITFKALPLRDITAGTPGEPLDHEYLVAFDDIGHQEPVSESWLELE